MNSVISDIGQRKDQIIPWLPLEVQTPVFGILSLLVGSQPPEIQIEWVMTANGLVLGAQLEENWFGATAELRHVVNQVGYTGDVGGRGRQW